MKRSILFFCVFLIVYTAIDSQLVAQVLQPGVVKQYDGTSKKTPLPGVAINVAGAGSTVSNNQGEFVLKFVSQKRGDAVKCNSISKAGYEVFNKDALEQWNINPEQPFTIILCQSKVIKQIADKYYAASSASYAHQMKTEQEQLRRDYEKGKIKEDELNKKIAELESLLEQAMGSVRAAANEFAYVDLDDLSAGERRAVELVQKGDFAEGLAVYEKMGLVDGYTNKKYDKQVIDRYIKVCRLAGGTENLLKIESLLDDIFNRDSTDIYVGAKLAARASELGKYDKALSIEKKCLSVVETRGDPYRIAEYQQSVGVYYYDNDDNKKALEYLNKSETNLRKLLDTDDSRKDSILASYVQLLDNKANIYNHLMQYDSAQANYERALALSKQLLELDTAMYAFEYCMLNNNIGHHYNNMNYKNNSNYHRAAVYLDEAMKWAQQIEDETYRLAMIMSLHYEYSRMYLSTEKYYKGLSSMQQSMEACEKLYQKDPLAYQMTYARKCRDLGWSISYSNDYTEAVKYINRSLLILDSVEPMFPTKINHSKSIAYSYLGHIYFAMDDSKHSIENYEKALLYASKAYNNDPEGVIQTLFDVESNLGAHYCSNGNTDRGLELIQKSAIHLQVLYDADPSTYKQEFLKIHIILLYIYLQSGMTEEMMAEYLMLKEVDPDNSTVKQIEEYISSQR